MFRLLFGNDVNRTSGAPESDTYYARAELTSSGNLREPVKLAAAPK